MASSNLRRRLAHSLALLSPSIRMLLMLFPSERELIPLALVVMHGTRSWEIVPREAVRRLEAHAARPLAPTLASLDLHGFHTLPNLLVASSDGCGVHLGEVNGSGCARRGGEHCVHTELRHGAALVVVTKQCTVCLKLEVTRLGLARLPVYDHRTVGLLYLATVLTDEIDERLHRNRKPWKATRGV